jgi:GMP synthase (glutamine-hydrolysing)
MSADRLKSSIWVQACVFRADREGIAATVLRRGDADSGSILVRLDRRDLGCAVLAETRDTNGDRAWFRGTGPEPVTTETADLYIARHVARDPDIWVVEIDDRHGRLPFDDRILPS